MTQTLFLYLKAFSFTGGIEKFNRVFLKALGDLNGEGYFDVTAIAVHDHFTDKNYFPASNFIGCKGNKLWFSLIAFLKSLKSDVVIVGHINLAIVGYCIKKIHPSVKIILITHGIEVWQKQSGVKRKLLQQADWIFSVSNFTKNKIIEFNPTLRAEKIKIFPNALDPYFLVPKAFEKPAYLLKRYNLSLADKVLLTITRLSTTEKYKGYDQTIKAIAQLSQSNKNLRYVLCGKADLAEKNRIDRLVEQEGMQGKILLAGFISDEEVVDHYLLADVYVMPSKKEGFGIVFIEALACGRKVIAGQKDGSVEALLNGSVGQLIDPDSIDELKEAINKSLISEDDDPLDLQQRILSKFSFQNFKDRLHRYLLDS